MTCEFTSFPVLSVSVISGRLVGDNEGLCSMEPCLKLKIISTSAGLNPGQVE